MKQGINCSPAGRRNWKTCHQHNQLCINTSSEHCCRPASSGGKRPQSNWTPLISKTGAGRRPALVNGCHSGQLLRTAAKPVPSYCVVAVKCLAQGIASAQGRLYIAQFSANVKVDVSTMQAHEQLLISTNTGKSIPDLKSLGSETIEKWKFFGKHYE